MRKLRSPAAIIAGVAALAGLVVSTWWLFLGSDTTYQHDANGRASGPYEAPQVVACVAVLALLVVTGAVLLPVWTVILTVPAAFTIAWSISASTDRTGLWVVGAIGVLLGTFTLSCVVRVPHWTPEHPSGQAMTPPAEIPVPAPPSPPR